MLKDFPPSQEKWKVNNQILKILNVGLWYFNIQILFIVLKPLLFSYHIFSSIFIAGEHIDYCGYSVLPMAIEQSILAAVSVNNSGTIQLSNTNPQYK